MRASPASLGEFFASIICSKHNQNVMIRFVAIAGMGKSWSAYNLSIQIAKGIAKLKGGTWQDYFNLKTDFAIISQDKTEQVLTEAKPYHVLLCDDVAAEAMNARNFNSSTAKDLNSIITTWRPNHNCLITTQQAGFLVDKVWRNLFNYQIEIVSEYFDHGFVIAKVQKIVYKHNIDKTYYPYLTDGKNRFVRYKLHAPPKELTDEYEVERAIQVKAMKEREDKVIEPAHKDISKKDTFVDIVIDRHIAGDSIAKIAREEDISRKLIYEWFKDVGYDVKTKTFI